MTEHNAQVYQFRVFVRGITPAIWRRLLLRDDQTLADLHDALQIVFNWTDTFLHRFRIRGRVYAVPRSGGAEYTQAAQDVPLRSLHLRLKERLLYEYNLIDGWQVEIRLEKQLRLDETRTTRFSSVASALDRLRIVANRGRTWLYAKKNITPFRCGVVFKRSLKKLPMTPIVANGLARNFPISPTG